MQVGGGGVVDLNLNWVLQLIVTVFILAFGILHLVKNTASKYFVVDGNFDSSSTSSSSTETTTAVASGDSSCNSSSTAMVGDGGVDACAVCGSFTTKKCSGCKSVKYCSEDCQRYHWRSEHMNKCKDLQLFSSSIQRRKSSLAAMHVPGTCSLSKKILFPYDEFLKYFEWSKPGYPPCGLLNCGNSCFANVVLQCLTHTRPLVAYLVEKGHQRECRRNDWCFLCEFQSHVQRARQSLLPFSPINILSRLPNIGGNLGYGEQEDAHEFMRFAIDTMQSVCLEEFGGEKSVHPNSQETTLIQHIFGGHLQSQVICTKCHNVSNQYESMMDLTVEIQGDAESLEECLDQFTAREWLHGDNMYKCDGCNDYVMAWKRLTVRRAPNILTIALKRFQSGRFGKLNKRVAFPETLDLSPYMSEAAQNNDVYKLYAVIVHVDMLNASFFGHYICYIKDLQGNWFRIDDCKVSRVDLDEVLSQEAYMLLYSRVHARPSPLYVGESPKEVVQETVGIGAMQLSRQQSECSSAPEATGSPADSDVLASDNSSEDQTTPVEGLSTSSTDVLGDVGLTCSGQDSSLPNDTDCDKECSVAAEEDTSPVGQVQNTIVANTLSAITSSTEATCEEFDPLCPMSDNDDKSQDSETTGIQPLLAISSINDSDAEKEDHHVEGQIPHIPATDGSSNKDLDEMHSANLKGGSENMDSGNNCPSSNGVPSIGGISNAKGSSGTKLKPIFAPGFLGKRSRDKSVKLDRGALPEAGGVYSRSNLSSKSNGFGPADASSTTDSAVGDKGKLQFAAEPVSDNSDSDDKAPIENVDKSVTIAISGSADGGEVA